LERIGKKERDEKVKREKRCRKNGEAAEKNEKEMKWDSKKE